MHSGMVNFSLTSSTALTGDCGIGIMTELQGWGGYPELMRMEPLELLSELSSCRFAVHGLTRISLIQEFRANLEEAQGSLILSHLSFLWSRE